MWRKTTGKTSFTCGIMLSFPRRSWSPIVDMSIPSMKILPPAGSRILNKQFDRVDLPAPVLPTIPICKKMMITSSQWGLENRTELIVIKDRCDVRLVGCNFANENNLKCYGKYNLTTEDSISLANMLQDETNYYIPPPHPLWGNCVAIFLGLNMVWMYSSRFNCCK